MVTVGKMRSVWDALRGAGADLMGLGRSAADWGGLGPTRTDWDGLKRTGTGWDGQAGSDRLRQAGTDWDRLGIDWDGRTLTSDRTASAFVVQN